MRIPFWPALVCGWLVAAMIGQTGHAAGPADELSEAATFPGSIDGSDRDENVLDSEDASVPGSSFAPMQYSNQGASDPYGPGTGPVDGAYGPPINPGNPWPEVSPFSQHRMEQYLNNNGLWQYDSDDHVNKKRIFGVDYLFAHGLRQGDHFIGDPNFNGTLVLPDVPLSTVPTPFPSFSTGTLGTNTNVFHNGFRPYYGYENPDGSGLILSGFVLFENDVNNSNRIPQEILGNTQLLASIPVDANGTGVALPIDTRVYNQFTQQILGADLDYYSMPFFSRTGFQLKMVYGAKYLQISEQFLVDGLDSGTGYTIMATGSSGSGSSSAATIVPPIFPITEFPYHVIVASSVTSNLVGPMLGVRYEIGGEHFKVWGQSKFGVMADIERINVASAGLNEIKIAVPIPAQDTLVASGRQGQGPTNFTQTNTHIAPLFETSINAEFPFFKWVPYVNKIDFLTCAKVRIGWNFVVADAISRPSQIISYNLDAAGINGNRSWWEYNAFNFGLTWKY
jgi:hypothetical protein